MTAKAPPAPEAHDTAPDAATAEICGLTALDVEEATR